jgi:hypothetical protein
MSTDKTPESEAAQQVLAVPARVEPTRDDLIAALRFYASGQHFSRSDDTAWDTTSGEPQNWWCDEAGTATIEDGAIAAMVLDGRLNAAQIEFLGDGEVVPEPAEAAQPAPTAAPAEPHKSRSAVEHVVKLLTLRADDPMWANHAEVSKVLLRNAAMYLRDHPALVAPPPARLHAPLSDEQIDEMIVQEQFLLVCDDREALVEIIRAVELVHGIKESGHE